MQLSRYIAGIASGHDVRPYTCNIHACMFMWLPDRPGNAMGNDRGVMKGCNMPTEVRHLFS